MHLKGRVSKGEKYSVYWFISQMTATESVANIFWVSQVDAATQRYGPSCISVELCK